jgi:hypothetical protein
MKLNDKAGLKGQFAVQCVDKDGNVKWEQEFPNGITDSGIQYLLDTGFDDATKITTWYIGLIDNASFSALDPGDTADQINGSNGWNESTAYTETNRVTWANGATSARSMTNATTADFSMNATASIRGIFIVSSNTKSGTTGTLWSTATFSSVAAVTNGDTLKITYTING